MRIEAYTHFLGGPGEGFINNVNVGSEVIKTSDIANAILMAFANNSHEVLHSAAAPKMRREIIMWAAENIRNQDKPETAIDGNIYLGGIIRVKPL